MATSQTRDDLLVGDFTIQRPRGAFVVRGRGVIGVFTTKSGPVRGLLGGTNLSATVGDDPEAVRDSRRWAGALGGFDGDRITFGYQVHGSRARTVLDASAAVGVAPSPLSDTDALVTDRAGTPIGVLVADCVPTLLVGSGAVGVVHSGWRGVLAGVLESALGEMGRLCAGEVMAFCGPCIGPCCFEVSDEIASAFGALGPRVVVPHVEGGRPHVDLRLAVARALAAAGVRQVVPVGGCTRCDSSLWSHRRGEEGRQALVAAVDGAGQP